MKPGPCCVRRVIRLIESAGPNWLFEAGIGEDRAALVENGKIVEARIERHSGLRAGDIVGARIVKKLSTGKRAITETNEGGHEVMLSSIPDGMTEGEALNIRITREAVNEKTRFKWPLAKAIDAEVSQAPSLVQAIGETGTSVQQCHAHEADHFGDAGWHEVVEEARSGQVGFPGGSLLVALTPAMTLIDVDGELPAMELAIAAADASARAIRRLALQGSIGIDFPAASEKASRKKIADKFDAAMFGDFERTAVNGFGFMQIVTRRVRPSLPELLQGKRMTGHALELLRLAERSKPSGAVTLTAHPAIISKLEKREDWRSELQKRTGREVTLQADPKLTMGGGYVS